MEYIKFFKRDYFFTVIWYLLCLLSLGMLFILARWIPWLELFITHTRTKNSLATKVLIKVLFSHMIILIIAGKTQWYFDSCFSRET